VQENPGLHKFFSFYYHTPSHTLCMSTPSVAHQRVILELCDLQRGLFDSCVCRIGKYKILFGNEQTFVGPLVDAHQINSTLHIPNIVVNICFKYGEYEVGIIEVGSTETWSQFSGLMREYQYICSRSAGPPVFVGGVKIFEHTKFKRPKLICQAGQYGAQLQQWKDLPLTALTELLEDEAMPEGGEVEDDDVDKIAEPAPGGHEFILTRCITANGHIWCGELSAWFVLFDVSKYLSEDEREEISNGLISGKSLEEWAALGYALPMLEKYDDYPKERYDLFCARWRRIFARARFEVWKLGFMGWEEYTQRHNEADCYETAEDVERDVKFSTLGADLKRQMDGDGLPTSFRLPFGYIVNAVRHGAMRCARDRLETFKMLLPGEIASNHTTSGLTNFEDSASSTPDTDEEIMRLVDTAKAEYKARLARVRQREGEAR